MNSLSNNIRTTYIFILLLSLNIRFLYDAIVGGDIIIFWVISIIFTLLAIDYKALTKEYVGILLILFVVSLAGYSSNVLNIFTLLLVMQGVFFIELKTYLKINVLILGPSLILMYLLYGIGSPSTGNSEIADMIMERTRYNMGYQHPNVAALYYYGFLMSGILLMSVSRYKKYIWIGFLVIGLIGYYVYSLTVSRSFLLSIIVFFAVIVYYFIRRLLSSRYKIGFTKYLIFFLPVILTGLTFYLGWNAFDYGMLNLALSGRLSLYYELLYSSTAINYILGNPLVTDKDLIIDTSYLNLIFSMGIILFLYFLWLYFKSIKNIIVQQNYLLIAVVCSILAYGLMESFLIVSTLIGNMLLWIIIYKYRYQAEELFDVKEMEGKIEDIEEIGKNESL